ncbi:MAG: 3-hydroxyacyl-CoA dehydrogenase NAD-binding domain-containing protein [Sedimentitalea sp.]
MSHFGVLGAGLIGQSWTALFLAHGHRVSVVDPRPETAREVDEFVARAWPNLQALGLTQAATPAKATVSTDMKTLKDIDFVQENGPDRIEVKQALMGELEQVIAPDVIVASSTSSLMASDIQAHMQAPERLLVAHPMNPPHMVAMVEMVAGRLTTEQTVDRAETIYRALNRVPIRVRKEVPGHLANRLTAALYREAVHMVAEGIADVADIDRAIAYGPGMRWAFMGPHLTYHLGGGPGGYRHYLDHLGPTQEARWRELGQSALDAPLKDQLVAEMDAILSAMPDADTLQQRRDAALVALAGIKKNHGF